MLHVATTRIRKGPAALLSALGFYLALSIVIAGPPQALASRLIGVGGDSYTAIWCLKWWPWAIRHGLNPFVSHKVWAPGGIDMTWVTSVPALALLTWPLTALSGPLVTYNLLCLASPALSAWAAFLLARHVTGRFVPALIAGYVYGFSNYEMAHRLSHLNLFAIFVPPLLVLACVMRVDGTLARRGAVAALTAGFLLQLGISPEILCTAGLFGALSWLVFFATLPALRPVLSALALDVAVAGLCAAILGAPFLVSMIVAMRHLPPVLNSPVVFSADLAGFLTPGPLQQFGSSYFLAQTMRFSGNLAEQTAYLGLPLLLILVVFFAGRLSRPHGRALLAILAALALCSLGPLLWINGALTRMHLPWVVATRIPLLRSALPGRLSAYVSLLAGLVAALWLAEPAPAARRAARLVVAGVMCASLWPASSWMRLRTPVPQPAFFARGAPSVAGQTVLILPFGPASPAMVWQARAHFSFAQAGGYTGLVPPSEARDPMFAQLTASATGPGFAQALLAWCRARGVSAIIAGPGTTPGQLAALHAIGWTERADGGVLVFARPGRAAATRREAARPQASRQAANGS